MRVQEILRASKTITDWGKPQQGNMGAAILPMSKRPKRCYQLGNVWRWRLIKFIALNQRFRILVTYHIHVDKYQAFLAMEVGGDCRLLAEYAYDPSHGAWHFHATCGDTNKTPTGVMKGPWQRRIPKARSFHRRVEYTRSGAMSDNEALQIATRAFKLELIKGTLFETKDGRAS